MRPATITGSLEDSRMRAAAGRRWAFGVPAG
jgi:hypothetical protein